MYFDEQFKYQRENVSRKITNSEVTCVICVGITVQVVLLLFSFYRIYGGDIG